MSGPGAGNSGAGRGMREQNEGDVRKHGRQGLDGGLKNARAPASWFELDPPRLLIYARNQVFNSQLMT